MKLKLDAETGIKILSITESVSAQDAAILKAGLMKLFTPDVKVVILNLAQIADCPSATLIEISNFRNAVPNKDARLLIVHSHPDVADAPSIEKAKELATSPLGSLLAMEARLQSRLKSLKSKKAELEQKIGSSGGKGEDDVKTLKKENSDLKRMIKNMHKEVETMLKERQEPITDATLSAQATEIDKILITILSQEGFVSGK